MEKGPGEWYIRTVGIGGIESCLFRLLKQPARFKRSPHPAHLNLTGTTPRTSSQPCLFREVIIGSVMMGLLFTENDYV